MNKPAACHMETYLKYLDTGSRKEMTDPKKVEAAYLRSIFKVLPRDTALRMTLKQARAQTSIRP